MKLCTLAIVLGTISTCLNASNLQPAVTQSAPVKTQAESAQETQSPAHQNAAGKGPQEQASTSPAPTTPSQPGKDDLSAMGMYRPGAGTMILAQLSRSIDVRKLKVGSQVEGYVTQDLLYKGKVIVPRDAKVIGHVTEAEASTKEKPHSRLALLFDKIILKGKKELKFQYAAVITALAPPIRWGVVSTTRMQDMPVQMEKGIDTGGAAVEALVANPGLAGANMRSAGIGAINPGSKGVTGLKDLGLETTNPEAPVIVSRKGDIKLGFDTQMVLRVSDPPKK